MRSKRLLVVMGVGAVLVACGGATASDLFGDPATDAGTSTPSPTITSTGTPTTPPTNPTTPPTTPPTNPPPIPDAGPPKDDAGRVDAGRDAGPTTSGITCGTKTCALADTCCANFNATNGTYAYECKTGRVTCAEPSTQIECDSNEDCAGNPVAKTCCGDRVSSGGSSYYNEITCVVACTGNDVVFCNPANPSASCGTRPCVESTILRGYYACSN